MRARCPHPNVCRVYDIGEIEGRPFLSMEFVDGEDLATAAPHRPAARGQGRRVARQLCAGLAAATTAACCTAI